MKVMSYFWVQTNHGTKSCNMRERERGKTCKQNREGYIYTERERERREIKRDSEIERERVHMHMYMNA